MLDHQHIKKRRRDRTRLRSFSVTNVSTSARTRPLHSFQKRKLYRMHGACDWNPQVGLCISLFRRQKQSPAAGVCMRLSGRKNGACCVTDVLLSGSVEVCQQELRVNELNVKIQDCSESCFSNEFVAWLYLKSRQRTTQDFLWEA